MPALTGFSDNPFVSRDDVLKATLALLCSLQKHQSPGGARIRVNTATAAHFDEGAAQLEGFARSLWAVAAISNEEDVGEVVGPFVQGLANGTDPKHAEYWGPITNHDQRRVECEIIAFALLAAPGVFYEDQSPQAKAHIVSWLNGINDYPFPPNNWLWFRVMTNLALIQCCGTSYQQIWPIVERDLEVLDSFLLENGWSSDGLWDERPQADYYSGSFAIQFSQLLYVKFAHDLDPVRCNEYRRRAREFSQEFVLYFDKDGSAIPFGRSLTYRFAFAGFWSVAAFAGVELPAPLNDPGIIKGLLLRHLRWWSTKHNIFNSDGTLNVGFSYPNMYMCEDYNSPQSPYWSMKTFIALALPESHQFWQAEERAFPQGVVTLSRAVEAPRQILCNSGSHHFLLSSGQHCLWPIKATEAKYGKFAYSSHFGFSVPTGPRIEQLAPDSALAVSIDNGESWRTRWISRDLRWTKAVLRLEQSVEELPVLMSTWKPWSIFDITVSTALIPPSARWPDWHIRIHRFRWPSGSTWPAAVSKILAVEGGFAIYDRNSSDGRSLPVLNAMPGEGEVVRNDDGEFEAVIENQAGCCVYSRAGASGVRQIHTQGPEAVTRHLGHGSLLKPDSNTNLMCQRTVIPTIVSELPLSNEAKEVREYTIAVAVFATTATSADVVDRWTDSPVVQLGGSAQPGMTCIELQDF